MTKTNEKIHVLADESLGGIKREYVEVDRKAEVDDLIVITASNYEEREEIYVAGHYGKVISESEFSVNGFEADFNGFDNSFVGDDGLWYVGGPDHGEYRVLEPTNIVHIDGPDGTERYEMVDRKAEVGEKVIHLSELYSDGTVTEVTSVGAGMVDVIEYEDSDGDITCGFSHGCYRVLVTVESSEEEQPQPSDPIDVIANLATRVAELERENRRIKDEIDTLHKDNRRHGEELEALKYAAKETDGKVAHLEADSDMRLFTVEEVAALLNAMRERQ